MTDSLNGSRDCPRVILVNPQAGGGKARHCLPEIKSLLAARGLPCEFILTGSAEEMASRVRLTADRACLFHGDGEILGPAPVEIEVVPKAIRVLAPIPRHQ